ncbi:hypothetical protein BDV93DRAFT_509609 [Ceratobasidium sp. AG-I]|nr:hypothetical protein BDV93DRAFT_509609 [Ceratobasidium sp. AG-I]
MRAKRSRTPCCECYSFGAGRGRRTIKDVHRGLLTGAPRGDKYEGGWACSMCGNFSAAEAASSKARMKSAVIHILGRLNHSPAATAAPAQERKSPGGQDVPQSEGKKDNSEPVLCPTPFVPPPPLPSVRPGIDLWLSEVLPPASVTAFPNQTSGIRAVSALGRCSVNTPAPETAKEPSRV